MNDWAADLARSIKKRQEDEKISEEKFVQQHRLKTAFGPTLWAELRKEIEEQCRSFNSGMGETVLSCEFNRFGQLVVTKVARGKRKELRIKFEPEIGQLAWESEGQNNSAEVAISLDGKGSFRGTSIPSMAREILEPFLI
jgi:hypothetical protein